LKEGTVKLTALVITYNEMIHIEELIASLSFADELIVVDSFSTDGTFEKLSALNHVNVVQHKFESFAEQKNYALSLANHDWVLFIDADERISEEFKKEVHEKINALHNPIAAYYSLFQYHFGQTPIKYSGFQTAKSHRLFKVSKCSYDTTKKVHENLIVDGESGLLNNRIKHFSFRNYEHYKEKMKHYAHIKARELHKKGKRSTFFASRIKPLYRFFNHFVMRLGILDGKIGYIISKLNAFEVKERYRELDRLNDSLSK